jgi:hypothetical protein
VVRRVKKLDIGQTITILANAGVIIGIVFLAFEIRQNTTAVQASTFQDFTDSSEAYLIDLAINPDLLRVLLEGANDPSQLDEIERVQANLVIRRLWTRARTAYLQWQRGSLSESDWEVFERNICDPGELSRLEAIFWKVERVRLPDDFMAFVEECRPDLQSVVSD